MTTEFSNTAHALIIGVGDYIDNRFSDLPATSRDAKAIAAVLTDPARCGYSKEKVDILTGENATGPNIRQSLESLPQKTNAQSTVFVFFSGHGGRIRENGEYRAYICPREADPDNLSQTAISGEEFSNLLAAVPAQKMLVILDACHAGGSADLKSAGDETQWKSGFPDNYYEALSQGTGRVIVASSKEEQRSYVRPEGDFSVFTWHLREALRGNAGVRGDGLIHVLDVFHYVNEKVRADKPMQIPILKVRDLDLNFALALDKGGKGAGDLPTPTTTLDEILVSKLDVRQKAEFVTALLECASMRDKDTRNAILDELPPDIRNTISRHSVDRVDVMNIVSRCLNFSTGIGDLIAGLRIFEGNSLEMQNVEALLMRLGRS